MLIKPRCFGIRERGNDDLRYWQLSRVIGPLQSLRDGDPDVRYWHLADISSGMKLDAANFGENEENE